MRRRTTSFRVDRPTVAEIAAGAVVRAADNDDVLLLHHAAEERWCFPKGHIEPGESPRVAAAREIAEESGLPDVELGEEITSLTYRFYDPERDLSVVKTTIYFLGRSPRAPFHLESTFDQARWAPLLDARRLVGFDSERAVLDHLRGRTPAHP